MRRILALGLAALLCLSSCGVIPSETGNGTAYDATAAETASYLTFRTEDKLQQHFEKHGQETGCATAEEYLAAANAVVANPAAFHKLQAEDGDDLYFLESTGEFVVVSPAGYIRTYCLEHPDSAMALPEVSAAVYPETGETRILELHFTYSQPRDTLRSMQAAVNTILDSAAAYVESGTTPRRCAELLARFLLTRFTYTTAEETPDMPAYDLLSSGRAHSLSFASVFYAECTRAGLACRLVSGTRGGETHWWNLLQLEETWYAVDLMRSVEQGGDSLDLLDPAALRDEGYDWDAEAYPSNPVPEPEEPTEP